MKKRLLGFSLIIFFTCCQGRVVLAQSVCAATLSDAQDNFDSGHLYGIPAILKPCLDKGFTDAEKIQAYWLLSRTYLIIDDPISAEDSYLKLLKLDPEFKVDIENDPIEIVHLSQKFKTTPIFTWTYGKLGFNTTKPTVINTYSTSNNNSVLAMYSRELGFQLSSSMALNINHQWSFNGELMFSKRSFSYDNRIFTDDVQSYKENQFWIEIPFYAKYSREYDRWHPYVYGGYAIQFLMSANAKSKLINIESESEVPVTGPNVNMSKSRNRFNQAAIAGVGVRYRLKYSYLEFEVRYTAGLKNLLKEDNQYGKTGDDYSNELLFRYGYVDSDFRIKSTSFTFGYVHPFYKPRKVDAKLHLIQRLFRKKGEKRK